MSDELLKRVERWLAGAQEQWEAEYMRLWVTNTLFNPPSQRNMNEAAVSYHRVIVTTNNPGAIDSSRRPFYVRNKPPTDVRRPFYDTFARPLAEEVRIISEQLPEYQGKKPLAEAVAQAAKRLGVE